MKKLVILGLMQILNGSQLKRLSEFFSNMAIAWLAAAFIGAKDVNLLIQYGILGILSLLISL